MIPTSDYELVAGEGVELVDDPTAKTTTINVTAEGTPVTAIEQMIESATSRTRTSKFEMKDLPTEKQPMIFYLTHLRYAVKLRTEFSE